MQYIFDTNPIIYYLQGIDKAVKFFELVEDAGEEINISVITKIELLSVGKEDEIKNAERLLRNSNLFSLVDNIVDETIEIRKKHRLKLPDAIIAATALVNNCALVTHNIKDFEKVRNLKVVDPLC